MTDVCSAVSFGSGSLKSGLRSTSPSKKRSQINDNSNVKARYLMTSEEIARVSLITDEKREKIREDTAKIKEKMERFNANLRVQVAEEHNRKIAIRQKNTESLVNKWVALNEKSPFKTDFNLEFEKKWEARQARESHQKERKRQANLIRKMSGLPPNDIQDRAETAETIKDMKSKLALQYRVTKLGRNTLLSEKETLDGMVMHECESIVRRFPAVGLTLALRSNSYLGGGSGQGSPQSPASKYSSAPVEGSFDDHRGNAPSSFEAVEGLLQNNVHVGRRRFTAEEIAKMKRDRDNTDYRMDGRYDVSGNFIDYHKLK